MSKFLTVREAAGELNISEEEVWALLRARKIPYVQSHPYLIDGGELIKIEPYLGNKWRAMTSGLPTSGYIPLWPDAAKQLGDLSRQLAHYHYKNGDLEGVLSGKVYVTIASVENLKEKLGVYSDKMTSEAIVTLDNKIQ